jgi:hypothetical protein
MTDARKNVPPPFDQGVFLIHYNRGRGAFQSGRYAEARQELEAAQKMRPDDSEVLNLLGLVYFKLEAYPEAEFIYRRLVAENDDVFILHSNLGLILFKQKKLSDAEQHLLRAVELRPNYAKSHLYLGLLYKNRGKLGLALEHLKFAGADKVVQEVERALMDRETTRVAPPPPSESQPRQTVAGGETRPASAEKSREALAPPLPAPPAQQTEPRTPAPPSGPARTAEEDPFASEHEPPRVEVPPRETRAAAKLQRAVDETDVGEHRRIDLRKIEGASRIFTLHENGFLEINFSDSVRVKRGTISSYSGNLRFREEPGTPGTPAATMVRAEGQGRLVVYEKGKQTFLLDLSDEFIFVQSGHLLAVENTLSSRPEPIYDSGYQNKLDTVKVFGRGSLAISTTIEPLSLRVNGDYPLSISSKAIVAWTGSLVANVVDDRDLDELMAERDEEAFTIRFEGDGVVVSER